MNKHVLISYEKYKQLLKGTKTEEPTTTRHKDITVERSEHLDKKHILEAVPKPYRERAKALLHYFDWNEKGELISEDGPVRGSHMSDLLRYTQHAYKHEPIGLVMFVRQLHRVSAPKGLIRNEDIWDVKPPGYRKGSEKEPKKWQRLY